MVITLNAVASHSKERLAPPTGIVRALAPHPNPDTVFALLEGGPTRVAMKKTTAMAATVRPGRFEAPFFEEKKPKAWAYELGFRPLEVGPLPPNEPHL